MKKRIGWIFALVCIMTLLVGCEKQSIPAATKTEEPTATEESSSAEKTALTETELAYFNGDSFFNGEYLNIRNQFLSSIYNEPADIDLFGLFYCGSGNDETFAEGELKAVMERAGIEGSVEDLPCGCEKVSLSNVNKVLSEYMGITLADTNKIGLDHFVFLSQYDAYYHFHGDTNYRGQISFSRGEREGDLVRLFYNDNFFGDGYKVLTLREKNRKYLFVANQMDESKKDTSNIEEGTNQANGTKVDYAKIGFELEAAESAFILNNSYFDAEVVKYLGVPEKKSEPVVWGSDGLEHQTWYYDSKGMELDVRRNNENKQIVYSIKLEKPCVYKTSRQIGIGSTKDEVLTAYKEEINPEEDSGDSSTIVAGSIYGGLIFALESDVVVSIFIGAAAE